MSNTPTTLEEALSVIESLRKTIHTFEEKITQLEETAAVQSSQLTEQEELKVYLLNLLGYGQFSNIQYKFVKILTLVKSDDIMNVNMGLELFDMLAETANDIYHTLGIDEKSKGIDAILENLSDFDHRMSIALWVIGKLAELEVDWAAQIKTLDLNDNQLTALPEQIQRLTNLTTLNLSSNRLISLPEQIQHLTNLTTLNLRGNPLESIPIGLRCASLDETQINSLTHYFTNLSVLEQLDLSNNRLSSLPNQIQHLTNLTTLKLGGNSDLDFEQAFETLAQLPNLTSLELNCNELTSLPEQIQHLTKLTTLYLSDNQLTSLPESIRSFLIKPSLTVDLDNNPIVHSFNLDKEWTYTKQTELDKITTLDLNRQELTYLPTSIEKLKNLTTLDLNFNELTSLPEKIQHLTNLTSLSLGHNRLSSLPESIWYFLMKPSITVDLNHNPIGPSFYLDKKWTNTVQTVLDMITTLDLNGQNLTYLPTSIENLTNLTTLNLSANQLTSLPEHIQHLTNLTTLNLCSNRLTSLPEQIQHLTNLTTLDLHRNQLTSIPEQIQHLTNLTTLNLWGNKLTSLPEQIQHLSILTTLILWSNNISKGELAKIRSLLPNCDIRL